MSEDLSQKRVLWIDNGLFIAFALRCAPAFKETFYWTPWANAFPKSNSLLVGDGFDEITRVRWLHDAIEKADLIVVPDVYHGDLQEKMVRDGKRVWGARKGEILELDRWRAKQIMQKCGVNPSPAELIYGLRNLRNYLKEHPEVWIKVSTVRGDFETFQSETYRLSEPKLDELETKLGAKKDIAEFIVETNIEPAVEWGIDAFTIDGQWPERTLAGLEIKDLGFLGRVMEWSEIPEYLRAPNEKLSPWFKEKQYRGFFSTELRITDDREVFMIDPCCYSADTDLLTDKGWKRFSELNHTEKVCTLNPETRQIEYQRPSDYISYKFDGNMVLFTSPKNVLDLLVTPNHSMLVSHRDKHAELEEFRADKVRGHSYLPRTGQWVGESPEFFVLPEYHSEWISGKGIGVYKRCDRKTVRIPIEAWLKFLAFYLSEGNCDEWCVNISQTKHKKAFRKVIASLPFKWTEHKKGLRIFDVQLVSYLQRFPKRHERGVDPFVKGLSPELINLFLDAYCLGDGRNKDGNQRIFTTTSKLTADDLQELCLKAGSCADISVRTPAGTPVAISEGKYTSKYDSLEIRERKTFDTYYFEGWNTARHARYLSRQPYCGQVYCVTVPNHIIYVRRNGKPVFCGNCRLPSPPNECQQMAFSNWPEILWEGAEGRMVAPNTVAKYGVCAMLHSAWADGHWQAVDFPEEVRPFVKLRNHTRIGGRDYVVPQEVGLPEMGAVIGLGDTLDDAIEHLKENAKQVRGYFIESKLEAIDKALEERDKAEKLGLHI